LVKGMIQSDGSKLLPSVPLKTPKRVSEISRAVERSDTPGEKGLDFAS
jgi:hypothetical protein